MIEGARTTVCRAGLAALAWVAACGESALLPLPKGLPDEARVRGGARVVLLDADLDLLADAVRTRAGASVAVAAAPWPIATGGPTLGSISADVGLVAGTAAWTGATRLQFTFPLQAPSIALTSSTPGRAGCALAWSAQAGQITVALEVLRGPAGTGAVLAAEPEVTWKQPLLEGPCMADLDPAGAAAVLGHVQGVLGAAVAARIGTAALATVRAVFPPALEVRGRLPFEARSGAELEARIDLAYDTPLPGQPAAVAVHSGARTEAALSLAVEVDRAPCAVDEPPPQGKAGPLPSLAPSNPAGKALLRRALAVDRAALQHLAYAATRAGLLCQDAWQGLDQQLPANWADAALPGLGLWVEGPPAGARFWPGRATAPERSSPEVTLLDGPSGPEMLWRLPAATLEILARVGEVEAVVIVVRGEFRVRVRLVTGAATAPGVELVSVERGTSQVSSPLLGNSVGPQEPGTSKLVTAAVRGIFARAALLSLGPAVPPGSVVTGTARAGDALWLWLDGLPAAGP